VLLLSKCWLLYLVLFLYPPPKLDITYLDNGSSSKEKIDRPTKKQTKKSETPSSNKPKAQSISKGQKTQTAYKNQAEESSETRAPAKTKKTKQQVSPAPATSIVLEKIIPSRNDIAKKTNPIVPKKSKKYSFLKLFLADFVQSVIREELGKKS
jgi:hypothetical protein